VSESFEALRKFVEAGWITTTEQQPAAKMGSSEQVAELRFPRQDSKMGVFPVEPAGFADSCLTTWLRRHLPDATGNSIVSHWLQLAANNTRYDLVPSIRTYHRQISQQSA
jgi:hypothetical protein